MLHQAKLKFPGKLAISNTKNANLQIDVFRCFLAFFYVILCERLLSRVFQLKKGDFGCLNKGGNYECFEAFSLDLDVTEWNGQIKDLDSRALILAFFAFFVDFLRNVVRKVLITTFFTTNGDFWYPTKAGKLDCLCKKSQNQSSGI